MSFPIGNKRGWSGQAVLSNATPVTIKTARNTSCSIFVTRVTLSITTHANAKQVIVRDTNGTPLVIAVHNDLTAAAGVPSTVTWEFGSDGLLITQGKNLEALSEASGVAGLVYAEGYEIVP